MTPLEQVIETAKTLASDDRRRLQEWLREQERRDAAQQRTPEPPPAETPQQQMERFRKAMKWVNEHRAEYLGQWVVLDGDRLISHGADGHLVYDQAKAAGIEIPFLHHVVEQPEAFCAGWK